MSISIIILCWNGQDFIVPCLEAVLAQVDKSAEVIVVDNASSDQSVPRIQSCGSRIQLIQNDYNLGFSGGNNIGLRRATGQVMVLLNQDTQIQADFIEVLGKTFRDPDVGVVGCKSLYPDSETIQHAGAEITKPQAYSRHIGQWEKDEPPTGCPADMDYVTGAALAIHRKAYEQVGELDDEFYPALFEDADYCYRVRRAGFRVVYQPQAVLLHHETASTPSAVRMSYTIGNRNRIRFALLHWGFAELKAFFNAEQRVFVAGHDLFLLETISQAYFVNLTMWPSILSKRQNNPFLGGKLTQGQIYYITAQLQQLCQSTRELLYKKMTEVFPLPSDSAISLLRTPDVVTDLIATLERNSHLIENPKPIAASPRLGPLITRLRAFWLAVFVRPYIVPLLDQQNQNNLRIAQILKALTDHLQVMISQQQTIAEQHVEQFQHMIRHYQAFLKQHELVQQDLLAMPCAPSVRLQPVPPEE